MRVLAAVAVSLWLVTSPAYAQLQAQVYVSGLSAPVEFVQDPTQPNVQFVVEQGGRIRVIQNGSLLSTDFLDLRGQVTPAGGEQGLLGLAFAPDYLTTRRFYVNFTNLSGDTVVARFKRMVSDPLRADPASRFDLGWPGCQRYITQPFANHNGGNLQFGDDGYLYIGLGDGGSGGDPFNNAQSASSLLGKMLRIDVNVPDGDPRGFTVPASNPRPFGPEVVAAVMCSTAIPYQQTGKSDLMWDIGLRNPWQYSFDLLSHGGSGALIIGDVGQNAWEEVDYEPYAMGNRNYGWRNREGAHPYDNSIPPTRLPLIDPIHEYDHTVGNTVIGGYVYRGTTLGAPYFGRYFFADLTGRVWSLRLLRNPTTGEATATNLFEHTSDLGGTGTFGLVSAFGLDANCELYALSYTKGQVVRLTSAQAAGMAGGCAPPDPFASLGGGIFMNGAWLPPNSPAAAPLPTELGTGPAPSAGTCTTAAPAAGWFCVNGGWLPPGYPTGGGSPPPPPSGPAPPAAPMTCTIAAPAAGWVCVNGGWLPPGYPTGGGSPPPPPPPSGPAPPSAPMTCTTAAPADEWVCINGGWLPPNHPLALGGQQTQTPPPASTPAGCATPDPFVYIPGMVGICINGGWIPTFKSGG